MTMSMMRLQVSVSPLTVEAGLRGFTTVPRGAVTVTGAKAPSLGWIAGSVTISIPIHTEASVTLNTQFTAPPTCGSVPVKSNSMSLPDLRAVTSMRTGGPVMPSVSM